VKSYADIQVRDPLVEVVDLLGEDRRPLGLDGQIRAELGEGD